MSKFPFCCDPVGTAQPHTIVNVGGFAESYVIGTGPNPFELRTIQSSDASATITQNADNIDITVPAPTAPTMANVGGFAESYVIGTGPNPFRLRTIQSSDASATITQNADNIDITVPAPTAPTMANVGGFAESFVVGTGPNPFELRTIQSSDASVTVTQNADNLDLTVPVIELPPEAWQVDTTTSISTSSSTFVTFVTMSGDAKVLDGEEWKINMGVLICCPYDTIGLAINAETRWLVETAAGVFTEIDRYSVDEHIIIFGLERSSPRERHILLTASMDAPRMRVEVRRTFAGLTPFFWEDARWGGTRIAAAP